MFRRSRTAEIGLGAKAWPIGSVHSPPQLPTLPLLDPPCLTPFLEKQYRWPWNFLNELAGTDLSEAQRHLQRHKDLACSLHTAGDRVLSNWVWFQFSQNTCSTPPHTRSPTCTLSEDHQTFTVSYGSHAQRGPVSLTRGTGRLGPYQTALFQTSPSCFQQRKSNDLNANKCSASQQLCDL